MHCNCQQVNLVENVPRDKRLVPMDYFKKFRARGSALEVTITTHKTNPSLVPYGMPPLSGGLEVKSPFFRATCSLSALLKKNFELRSDYLFAEIGYVLSKADHKALKAIGWSLPRLIQTSFKPSIQVISVNFQQNNNYLGMLRSIALKAWWSEAWIAFPASSEPLLSGIQVRVCDQVLQRACWWLYCVLVWLTLHIHINSSPWVSPNKHWLKVNSAKERQKNLQKPLRGKLYSKDCYRFGFVWRLLSKLFLETTIV